MTTAVAAGPLTGTITPTEAAIRIGVSKRTVQRWVAAGILAGVRLPSGRLRVRVDDVDALATPAFTAS